MVLDNTWTVATFPLDEFAATTGQYITVVSVDKFGFVVAAGNDDRQMTIDGFMDEEEKEEGEEGDGEHN